MIATTVASSKVAMARKTIRAYKMFEKLSARHTIMGARHRITPGISTVTNADKLA